MFPLTSQREEGCRGLGVGCSERQEESGRRKDENKAEGFCRRGSPFNVVFGLFAAYVLSRYNFWGRTALIVVISLPTAIPTAVAGFALLLLWGPYGTLGRLFAPHGVQVMFTTSAIILANIFVTFPLAFGVIKPVFTKFTIVLKRNSKM